MSVACYAVFTVCCKSHRWCLSVVVCGCTLFVDCCSLGVARCALFDGRRLLLVAIYLLCVVCGLLFVLVSYVGGCVLCVVVCDVLIVVLLDTDCCRLFVVRRLMCFGVYRALYCLLCVRCWLRVLFGVCGLLVAVCCLLTVLWRVSFVVDCCLSHAVSFAGVCGCWSPCAGCNLLIAVCFVSVVVVNVCVVCVA